MKAHTLFCLVVLSLCGLISCNQQNPRILSEKTISNNVDGITYESGNWEHPNYTDPFETLGNHRFAIEVKGGTDAVQVHLPWRRHDDNPENKDVIVVNATTNDLVQNKLILSINNEAGHLLFQPENSSDKYYIYYLPHKSTGSYYPKVNYTPAFSKADPDWLSKYKDLVNDDIAKLPAAMVSQAQSIDDFHSFFPMEIIATQKEVDGFLINNPKTYYLFPEYRNHPIVMTDYLPKTWTDRGVKSGIKDEAKRGEYYTFQIGVYSPSTDLNNVLISFSDLKDKSGNIIPQSAISSFNTSGTDLNGQPFLKEMNVKSGFIQPLWFGVNIAESTDAGEYEGFFFIQPKGQARDSIQLVLKVNNQVIDNQGDDNPENMTRLRWLNSTIGTDDEFIVAPFTPVEVTANTFNILGRQVRLAANGLPEKIDSYFSQELTFLNEKPEPILNKPMTFIVTATNGKKEAWTQKSFLTNQKSRGQANWRVVNESANFLMNVNGILEYDGMLNYHIQLIAKNDMNLRNTSLDVVYERNAAEYMVGLGRKGGKRPASIDWNWDVEFHQEGVWLGGVNKGLQYVLRDENYERPLNTNFYHNKPLNLPDSWGNDGKGGIKITQSSNTVTAINYSGARKVVAGDTLNFNVRFLITPFKLIDTKEHFSTRFVHKYVPVDSAAAKGGTVINVHHANEINPYINYPFFALEEQKAYIDEAHSKGIKVKLYNTIRELTYKSHELFALKSLGDEILNDGEGGGHGWLQEHMKANYHSAWHATRVNDAAILNKGTSRWTNYYIEGLNWLAKNQEIDGLYLDDIAFSRGTVKRIASVMNAHREDVIIDLHSANQYNDRDGFINSVFLYMEHIPYISRLWFGEYFDYDTDPDYWMTEVAGLPFGITGEMLEKGGQPFRGMVYGMTTRVYGNYDPSDLWHLFDDFGIADSQMKGYWVDDNPVKTNHKNIKTTAYLKEDKVLIAIGSWSDKDEYVTLNIDWNKLGLNKDNMKMYSPAVDFMQEAQAFTIGQKVKIPKADGLILVIENK